MFLLLEPIRRIMRNRRFNRHVYVSTAPDIVIPVGVI
jgi:hypothetical protein